MKLKTQISKFKRNFKFQVPMPSAIRRANHGRQRFTADPIAASFVADDVAPAAGARGDVLRVAAVRDRAGAGDEDHSRRVAGARGERDERVIDDERAHLESDPFHDPANGFCVLRPIDARGNYPNQLMGLHGGMDKVYRTFEETGLVLGMHTFPGNPPLPVGRATSPGQYLWNAGGAGAGPRR